MSSPILSLFLFPAFPFSWRSKSKFEIWSKKTAIIKRRKHIDIPNKDTLNLWAFYCLFYCLTYQTVACTCFYGKDTQLIFCPLWVRSWTYRLTKQRDYEARLENRETYFPFFVLFFFFWLFLHKQPLKISNVWWFEPIPYFVNTVNSQSSCKMIGIMKIYGK